MSYYRLAELGFTLPAEGSVIKAADVAPLHAAADILARAEKAATALLCETESRIAQAEAEGREAGQREALALRLNAFLQENARLDLHLAELEGEIADLVIRSVRQVIGQFSEEEIARRITATALARLRKQKRLTVHASVRILPALKQALSPLTGDMPDLERVDFVEDETLVPPHVVLEAATGRIDGDIGTALADLARSLGRPPAEDGGRR